MAIYNIPIIICKRIDIEANSLKEALEKVEHIDAKKVLGIEPKDFDDYDVNSYSEIYKDDELIEDKDGALFLSDYADVPEGV